MSFSEEEHYSLVGEEQDGQLEEESSHDISEVHKLKSRLFSYIRDINSLGTFATSGTVHVCLPEISVIDQTGNTASISSSTSQPRGIGLPLSIEDAQRLIRLSNRSKGAETLTETSVPNTWEIEPSQVSFGNPTWPSYVQSIVGLASNDLGRNAEPVKAELHKMLLHGKGSVCKLYQDDVEKVSETFGTLAICLPSAHKGGAVSLQHNKDSKRFETETNSQHGCTYLAWYNDVPHEMEHVTDGYRWMLMYNLVKASSGTSIQSAGRLAVHDAELDRILSQLHLCPDWVGYQIIPLDHQYPNEGLSSRNLKDLDSVRVHHVARVCRQNASFCTLLATMEKRVTKHGRKTILTRIADMDGFQLSIRQILIDKDDVMHSDQLDKEPDSRLNTIYRSSVMIIVDYKCLMSLLNGRDRSARDLDNLLDRLMQHPSARLLTEVCRSALMGENAQRFAGPVAVAACRMKDANLFDRAVGHAATGFDKTSWTRLGANIDLMAPVVSLKNILEALTVGKLRAVYSAVAAFRLGTQMRSMDSDEIARHEGWLASILMKTMENTSKVGDRDAWALVAMILEHAGKMRQFILFQGVRKLVMQNLATASASLPSALLLELTLQRSGDKFPCALRVSLAQLVSDLGFPGLTIHRCVDYLRRYGRCPGHRVQLIGCLLHMVVRELYELVGDDHWLPLLVQLRSHEPSVIDDGACKFILAILGESVRILGESEKERSILQWFAAKYIESAVGCEPVRPKDWARPEERQSNDSRYGCPCVDDINKFLEDPRLEKYEGKCEHGKHPTRGYSPVYLIVRAGRGPGEDKAPNTFTISKTFERWERLRDQWETNSKQPLRSLKMIPNLQQVLGEAYESIISLSKLRATDASPASRHKRKRSRS